MAGNDCSWKLEAKLSCRDIETGDGVPRDSVPLDLAASRSCKHKRIKKFLEYKDILSIYRKYFRRYGLKICCYY